MAAGGSYLFKMYDASCGNFLTSVNVTTPGNAGQLVCSAGVSTANVGDDVVFTAQGGTAPYTWATSNNSNAGNGNQFNVNFASAGNKMVSVSSSDGQTANCGVYINTPQTPQNSGNCNNDSNSCNNNSNTNNQNGSGNNSSNQNNGNNFNGSYNNVTNTNNNCVNNSCNNVYINSSGSVIPASQYSQLSITKMVSANGSGFQNSVSVQNGQTVQFQIVVTNTGNAVANNVRVTDNLPAGLDLISGSLNVGGNYANNGYSNNNYGYNLVNSVYLGNLSAGQSAQMTFEATVSAYNNNNIQNTATVYSDNAGSATASAWVYINSGSVQGGSVTINYSKSAYNNTKNANAASVTASRGDSITYTLTASNSGNEPATSFTITDDLSQVLPYADITDNGGGSVSGNTITFPGITVPADGSVTRSFQVVVKNSLATNLSYTMSNTYGNTVNITINTPQVLGAFTAPKTGADTNAFVFAGLITAVFAVAKKRQALMGFYHMIFS